MGLVGLTYTYQIIALKPIKLCSQGLEYKVFSSLSVRISDLLYLLIKETQD